MSDIEREAVIEDAEHEINQRWGEALGDDEWGPADPKLVRETAEAIVDPLLRDLQGAVEDRDHYRKVLAGLLVYARGNPHLLDKIHTALDSPPSGGQ